MYFYIYKLLNTQYLHCCTIIIFMTHSLAFIGMNAQLLWVIHLAEINGLLQHLKLVPQMGVCKSVCETKTERRSYTGMWNNVIFMTVLVEVV